MILTSVCYRTVSNQSILPNKVFNHPLITSSLWLCKPLWSRMQPIMYANCLYLLFVDSQGLTTYSSKDVFQTGIEIF